MRCGKNSTNYCCSADDCCSNESSNLFSMADPRITATAGVAPIVTSVNGTTTTMSPTSPAPTIASASTTSVSTTATQKPTQPTSTGTLSETSSLAVKTSVSHSQTVAIGAGVGVGVGVLALGCLAGCFFWRRRRSLQREETLTSLNNASASQGGSERDRWSQSASRCMSPPVKELASDSPFDRGLRELNADKRHRSVYEVE
jgi:hypothetical protein